MDLKRLVTARERPRLSLAEAAAPLTSGSVDDTGLTQDTGSLAIGSSGTTSIGFAVVPSGDAVLSSMDIDALPESAPGIAAPGAAAAPLGALPGLPGPPLPLDLLRELMETEALHVFPFVQAVDQRTRAEELPVTLPTTWEVAKKFLHKLAYNVDAQALFACSDKRREVKMAHLSSLLARCDAVLVSEAHGTSGQHAAWGAPAGTAAWWSAGASAAHAGDGIVVKHSFLSNFTEITWKVIWPGELPGLSCWVLQAGRSMLRDNSEPHCSQTRGALFKRYSPAGLWYSPVVFACGASLWYSPAVFACGIRRAGIRLWHSPAVFVYGLGSADRYSPAGLWYSPVVFACGASLWYSPAVFACGIACGWSSRRPMALSTYSCNVCEEPLVKSTAYVKHLRSDDWQGHRPVTCKDCYEKEDEYESKYTDKARWSELDGVIEDGAKRARVKKWSELEQSVRKDYPEASRSERRKATLFAIQKVARYIALKISQAPPEQRRQREQAFVEFDAEWDKKVADPEYVPEVRAYKMSDHAAQWASEIIEGLSEHFICRHRDCRECSRSCDWLMKGADQYGCPLCLRQYRRPTGHGFSSSWPDTTMATLINKFKEITAKLDAVLDGVPEKEQWRFVCSELQAKAAHPLTTQFLSPENIEELKRLNSTMRSPWRYDHILDKGFWSFRLADHGVANLDQPLSQDDVLSMFAWSKWLLRQYSGSRLYIHDPVKQGSLTEALAQATHRVFPPFAPELADTRATSRPRGAATVGAPWPRRLPAKRRGDAGVTRSAKALCTRRGESRTLPGPPVPEESAAKAPASLVAPDAPAGRGVGRRSLAQRAAAGRTLSRLVLLMDMHFFHEPVVFGTADPPRPRGGLVAISGGQLAFILGAFTRRGKPLADIAPLVACRDGGRDLLKASHSHATTCPASYLVDVGLHCAVATGVADRRGASILFEDVRESRCALPEPKADDLRQIRQAAQAWAGGDIELPCDGSCHVDHSVGEIIPAGEKRLRSMAESRAVARRAMPTPRARADRRGGARGAAVSRSPRTGLQKHLDEQKALGAPHHAAINSEDHKCFWVLDLPLPRQFDARRRRCRTCAAAGLPNRYFATDVSDVVAAVPGVLHLRLEKQGSVLMTKQFLLHLVQLFHDRLCLRQTRRALVEQCCAGAAGLRAAGRVLSYLRAIPTAPGLKQILLTALEGFLAEATRHMQKHINVYSGAVIRGDGNYVQARKVAAEGDGGRDRPRTVLLAWVTVDGALYQPPTLSRSEDVKDALQDLGPLAGSFKQDRLEAGLSLVDSAPAVHATDVYGRQRLQLNAFYRRMYPGLDADAAAGAPTPRGDATGARTRFAGSPTTVTGDPLHDTLAVMQLISAASPDARNMCYDHKGIRLLFGSTRRREDILNRLSLPPRRPAAAAPVPAEQLPSAPVAGPPDAGAGGPAAQPLAVEHHEMLRKAVENTKEQTAETIRENPASADAVAAYLKQPQVDQEPTWRTIFGASPTRGAVLRLCAAFGVHAHDTLGYHGFETLACFKNAIRTHLKWYAPGRKTCRAGPRLHGKRSALTMSVQAHYDRLLKPLRLEGLWKWRDAALAIADAGAPLQTGAVAVERWWASLKHMMPAKAVCISERWFRALVGLAYLRRNHRHFASGSLPSWCQMDPLLQRRLAYFTDCARLVQSEGDGHLSTIFDPFR
ncbi:unnamed protein product [Prorocentrum cordatum]|uniref:Calmodulin n=1 Tax=Prorocentrum cordatum TaxID=2364126 RepID=A0ABN9RT90_9DINO|nr:unnamed protein product [Polarella glacialis]